MGEVRVRKKYCSQCIYSSTTHTHYVMCGYCLMVGHSRIYKDGKRTVKKGYCNKFTPRTNEDNLELMNKLRSKVSSIRIPGKEI